MYCYNTILTICLGCEFLYLIGKKVNKFKHENQNYIQKILMLGCKLVENMENKLVANTFFERDFKDRTVIKIIIDNNFAPLMYNAKVDILL